MQVFLQVPKCLGLAVMSQSKEEALFIAVLSLCIGPAGCQVVGSACDVPTWRTGRPG